MYSDMNKEIIKRNDPKEEIEKSIEKETRVRILSSINQINNNSSEIESLTSQNDKLKKEIQKLEKINETATKKIISTENQINYNSSEIKSLISKNKDLIKELKDTDKMN